MACFLSFCVAGCAQRQYENPDQLAYEARVSQLRTAFESLSPDDQKAVREKRIGKGMHKDVVTLAWGLPKSVSRGMQNGEVYETWSYTAYNPRALHNQGMPAMQGPGFYQPSLSVEYALRSAAVVNLRNDRVVDWQQWEDDQPATQVVAGTPQFDIEEPAVERRPAAKKQSAVEQKPERVVEKPGVQDAAGDDESSWEEGGEFAPIGDEGDEFEVEIPPVEESGLLAP